MRKWTCYPTVCPLLIKASIGVVAICCGIAASAGNIETAHSTAYFSEHGREHGKASWFPDTPAVPHFSWRPRPCPSCTALPPAATWSKMASLAGISKVRFLRTADERNGIAYSVAPATIVLSPAALNLSRCALSFVIGHELTHLALRHYDQDVVTLAFLAHQPVIAGANGDDVIQLLDSDFSLALKMSPYWEAEEHEADWAGSLLAAQACGCTIEKGAMAFLHSHTDEAGGGIAAAHETDQTRIRELQPFIRSAHILADGAH